MTHPTTEGPAPREILRKLDAAERSRLAEVVDGRIGEGETVPLSLFMFRLVDDDGRRSKRWLPTPLGSAVIAEFRR